MRASWRFAIAATTTAFGLIGAACGSDDDDGSSTTTASAASETTGAPARTSTGSVTVFAATSLTDAFTVIGDQFSAANPDVGVTFNFAASSELVTQINEGAPADVYASADQNNMTKLVDAGGNAGAPEVFATNSLEIVVQPGNPLNITGVADLANPDLIVVTCAEQVPCGAYAAEVFANASVTVTPKSFEENVRAVLNKVVLGEADAGIVYATDVRAAGDDATGVEIPADLNVVAEYPIVATAEAANPDGASAFIAFVRSEPGQEILASYGFTAP